MCLGVPGQLVDIGTQSGLRTGQVDFGGIRKDVCLELTPEAIVGDFVLVHVGFALRVIDEDEARAVFTFLERMDELSDLAQETPNNTPHANSVNRQPIP